MSDTPQTATDVATVLGTAETARTTKIQPRQDSRDSLIHPDSHLVISTDLEPDDILALRLLFKELRTQYSQSSPPAYPSIQIMVGEGNAPEARVRMMQNIVAAAVDDGMIPPHIAERIEILPGSSSRGDEDLIHQYYNQEFFRQGSQQPTGGADIQAAQDRLIEGIRTAKDNGRHVVFMELKPLNDSIRILEECNDVLTPDDQLLMSGSFNVRQAVADKIADEKDAAYAAIDRMVNGGNYQSTVFESYHAYESEEKGLPKEIMRYPTSSDPNRTAITRLARTMAEDNSALGRLHHEAIDVWNRAVSYDCIRDCFTPFGLQAYVDNLEWEIFHSGNPIDEINKAYINTFNQAVFGKTVLTGKERSEAELGSVKAILGEERLPAFSRNWKVVGAIADDPGEVLIGDASLVAHAFHPDIYQMQQGAVTYDRQRGYANLPDDQVPSNTSMLTGVNDYSKLVSVLDPSPYQRPQREPAK